MLPGTGPSAPSRPGHAVPRGEPDTPPHGMSTRYPDSESKPRSRTSRFGHGHRGTLWLPVSSQSPTEPLAQEASPDPEMRPRLWVPTAQKPSTSRATPPSTQEAFVVKTACCQCLVFPFRAAPAGAPGAYIPATATATPDLSCICNLGNSLQATPHLKPTSEARDRTHILTDAMSGSKSTEPQWELQLPPISYGSLAGNYYLLPEPLTEPLHKRSTIRGGGRGLKGPPLVILFLFHLHPAALPREPLSGK